MNLDDIRKVLELVREHELAEFELEQDGLKLRVRKAGAEVALAVPAQMATGAALPAVVAPPTAAAAPPPPAPAVADATPLDLAMIKSPIVGTFYRAPEPGAANFVEVG